MIGNKKGHSKKRNILNDTFFVISIIAEKILFMEVCMQRRFWYTWMSSLDYYSQVINYFFLTRHEQYMDGYFESIWSSTNIISDMPIHLREHSMDVDME